MLNAIYTRISFIIFSFLTLTSIVNAQQASFIYFQSENNLPYQIQWKGQYYPSSSTGYLVIPQVMPGEHTLVVAFAPGIAAEQAYKIAITDKPRGFSIRQSADNKWSLFDMIDFSTIQGNALVKVIQPVETDKLVELAPIPSVEKKSIELPSQPSVEKKVVEKPQQALVEKKQVEEPPVVSAKLTEAPQPVKKEVKSPKSESPARTVLIQKIFDKEGSSGIDQVYIVHNGQKSDTIALFIPVLKDDQGKQNPGQIAKNISQREDIGVLSLEMGWMNRLPANRMRNYLQLK